MKMDPRKISLKEEHEMDYCTAKFSITRDQLRKAVEAVGNGRRKVYRFIRENYPVATAPDESNIVG